MTREQLEKAVGDIMLADMELLQEYDKADIVRGIMFSDDETLIEFLRGCGHADI